MFIESNEQLKVCQKKNTYKYESFRRYVSLIFLIKNFIKIITDSHAVERNSTEISFLYTLPNFPQW